MTARTLSSPASPPPSRIPINPMPSAAPASPTSATASSPPSPSSLVPFTADTNSSVTFSTTGKFPASSPLAADAPSTPPSLGDPNQDGNDDNDRLPGYSRNAFTGPDYASADLRLVRKIHVAQGYRLEFTADSFNLFNHDNQRVKSRPTA